MAALSVDGGGGQPSKRIGVERDGNGAVLLREGGGAAAAAAAAASAAVAAAVF